jgi:hypothetical protein
MKSLNKFMAVVVLFLLASPLPQANAGSGGGGMGDGQVYGESYFFFPGTGEWGTVDTGIPDDPMEYIFRLKCFDDSAGDIACLYENRRACSAGPDGRLVYWFKRLRETTDPWIPHGTGASCIYSEKPKDVGDLIRENILSEFQSQPIMPGNLNMEPSPHTLAGANTNLYASSAEQVFDFLLFDQNIRVIARPTEYEWNYGDGATYGPAPLAGAPLPENRWGEETPTSHVYRETGDFQAWVLIYFSGEYSINGGPMVPIDGRATVPSVPQTVSVWKAESRSVADNCLVNPAGFGC